MCVCVCVVATWPVILAISEQGGESEGGGQKGPSGEARSHGALKGNTSQTLYSICSVKIFKVLVWEVRGGARDSAS